MEPYQQWPLSAVTDCQIQMLAKRKQGPVLPTLVITMVDKERKRRSSRAGFMPTSKDNTAPALWFRSSPEDPFPTLQDWARFISSKRGVMSPDEGSPITSTSSSFSPRPRDPKEYLPRPGSGSNANRSLHHKASTATYSTDARERPSTFSSESPSLRSKRSDVSSPSSNYLAQQYAYTVPGQHYTTVLPTDLPSPVNTTGDHQGERSLGGLGRDSTVSSPRHGRESLGSHTQQILGVESSSPPGPRETILDRAFQMRYLQGAENGVPGEEKLSSVARFDALMREADEKRKQKAAASRAENMALRSAFEADDSSEFEDDLSDDDTDSDDGNFSEQGDESGPPFIQPNAHRALQYITGRQAPVQSPMSPRPGITRNPLSFHADAAPTLVQTPPARPHTAHEKMRRDMSQRSQSIQYLPSSFSIDMGASPVPGKVSEETTPRQSSSSTKRLSFTEFTKRLSSTSSLLLVQTNASGGSSHRSSEIDVDTMANNRTSLRPTAPPQQPSGGRDRNRDEQDKRCSWRGSVGVVGSEGGFF